MSARRPWIVCPECDGDGYVSRLGDFTAADVDDWYGDDYDARDEFARDYMRRGGPYDQHCPLCKGERVVSQDQVESWRYEQEAEAERRAEQRACGWTSW